MSKDAVPSRKASEGDRSEKRADGGLYDPID